MKSRPIHDAKSCKTYSMHKAHHLQVMFIPRLANNTLRQTLNQLKLALYKDEENCIDH